MSTKVRTSLWSAQTLTAGAGNTSSSVIDLSGGNGATVSGKITNGATGPTVPAQVQVMVANDYAGGTPTLPINLGGAIIASAANSAVSYFTMWIDPGYESVQLVAGSNTGQNVTIDADISQVTVLA